MSQPDVLASTGSSTSEPTKQQRKLAKHIWQPFLQYKPLMFLLGSTVLVALALGAFLFYAFSDVIGIIDSDGRTNSYYGEMIGTQLMNIFRYVGVLFMLYVILLAAVCITYTHRVIGPIHTFNRHIDRLNNGDYSKRIQLRKKDLPLAKAHAEKLNSLTDSLETAQKRS